MKKKIFTILLVLCLITGCSLFDKDGNKVPDDKVPTEEKEPALGDPVEVSDKEAKMFEIVVNYGKDIYEKKLYENLTKQEDGTYFISVNDLKNTFMYDISGIDEKCNLDNSGVIIDVDRSVHTDLSAEQPPVIGMLQCK